MYTMWHKLCAMQVWIANDEPECHRTSSAGIAARLPRVSSAGEAPLRVSRLRGGESAERGRARDRRKHAVPVAAAVGEPEVAGECVARGRQAEQALLSTVRGRPRRARLAAGGMADHQRSD